MRKYIISSLMAAVLSVTSIVAVAAESNTAATAQLVASVEQ